MEIIRKITLPSEVHHYLDFTNDMNNTSFTAQESTFRVSNRALLGAIIYNPVNSFQTLMRLSAQIAALNPDYQLYYRGQNRDYKHGSMNHSLRPSLLRLQRSKMEIARQQLVQAGQSVLREIRKEYGRSDKIASVMKDNPLARWALLQHYQQCKTPLLDLTRSLHVACSFARLDNVNNVGYVYILGMPYLREMIHTSPAEGLSLMALSGAVPCDARRPLNQEGYLAADADWWRLHLPINDADSFIEEKGSTHYDFNRRLLCVFSIPTKADTFYEDSGLSDFPKEWLYPQDDRVQKMLMR